MERFYTQRLTLLAVLFGLTFGILLLFINDPFAIVVALALLAGIAFAARREDLRALTRGLLFIALVVVIAVFTLTVSASLYSFLGDSLFYGLTIIDAALLVIFVTLDRGRGATTNGGSS